MSLQLWLEAAVTHVDNVLNRSTVKLHLREWRHLNIKVGISQFLMFLAVLFLQSGGRLFFFPPDEHTPWHIFMHLGLENSGLFYAIYMEMFKITKQNDSEHLQFHFTV